MFEKKRELYEARAGILKAMAHPARLFIVDSLARKSRCVAELTERIGSDMSTVSKHLSILRNAGIVRAEKKGVKIYYHLQTPCVMNFFGCVESVLKSTADRQLSVIK